MILRILDNESFVAGDNDSNPVAGAGEDDFSLSLSGRLSAVLSFLISLFVLLL